MHHLVYLPQHNTPTPEHLAEVGLADHAAGAQLTALPVDRRVTGEHRGGLICSWGAPPPLRLLEQLHWLPAMPLDGLPAERYFLGLDDLRPPTPMDVLKPQPFEGSPVRLGDGQMWVIPHAGKLPFDLIREQKTGAFQFQPRPQFYGFWTRCLEMQQQLDAAQSPADLPGEIQQAEFVEEALRLNYRLTPELIAYLRLLSSGQQGTLQACLTAARFVHPGEGAG